MNSAVKSGDTATARLITLDELMDNLGYNKAIWETTYYRVNAEYTPRWVYSEIYSYWTMSQYQDSQYLWFENSYGNLNYESPSDKNAFRPVLELNKSAEITKLAS